MNNFISLLLLLSSIQIGYSVDQCYHCMINCNEPYPIKNCSEINSTDEMYCLSVHLNTDHGSLDRKQCMRAVDTKPYCDRLHSADLKCKVCNTDLCNSAITSKTSLFVIVLLLLHFITP